MDNIEIVKELIKTYNSFINLGIEFEKYFKENEKELMVNNAAKYEDNLEDNSTIEFVKNIIMIFMDCKLVDILNQQRPLTSDLAKKYLNTNILLDGIINSLKNAGIKLNNIDDISKTVKILDTFIDAKLNTTVEQIINK